MRIAGAKRGNSVGSPQNEGVPPLTSIQDEALHDKAILVLAALTGIIA